MRINKIWEELEKDNSLASGYLMRRYSGTVLPNIFIALKVSEKLRCIAASFSSSIDINLSNFSNLKDINVALVPTEDSRRQTIVFQLLNNQHKDIFSVLSEDLITNISDFSDERQLINELFNRFEKWKSLFDKAGSEGLTAEAQRGLFGELYFLKKFLIRNSNYLSVINSWTGPEKQIRDFQSGKWSVEVKTTHGNNHQRIQINGERQLDISNLDNLFLFHLSLDTRQQSGETLNSIIQEILEILSSDFISITRFKSKLYEGGYFDLHKELYEGIGYFIRQETFYEVNDDFPRIEEKDLRPGVGDVKYSIVISQCFSNIRTEQQIFEKILS